MTSNRKHRQLTRHRVFYCSLPSLLRLGPKKAEELHPLIKSKHPEWCDDGDTIELGYQSREPKWQRAVRAALGKLQDDGIVEKEPRRNGYWRLIE